MKCAKRVKCGSSKTLEAVDLKEEVTETIFSQISFRAISISKEFFCHAPDRLPIMKFPP